MKRGIYSKEAIDILSKGYARKLIPEESGGYFASIQEFPGCVADGETAEEAIANLERAALSWIDAALNTGYEIKDPVAPHGYSGKLALRIPRGVHKQVAEIAEIEGTSINQLLVSVISDYVGSKRMMNEATNVLLTEFRRFLLNFKVKFESLAPNQFLMTINTPSSTGMIPVKTITSTVSGMNTFNLTKHEQKTS